MFNSCITKWEKHEYIFNKCIGSGNVLFYVWFRVFYFLSCFFGFLAFFFAKRKENSDYGSGIFRVALVFPILFQMTLDSY